MGVGAAETSTAGSQQSLLARELAPPKKRESVNAGCLLIIGVVVLIAGLSESIAAVSGIGVFMAIIGVLVAIAGGVLIKQATDFNRDEYPNRMAVWKRSFLCLRCGHRFEASV